jgi:hypothetical protein
MLDGDAGWCPCDQPLASAGQPGVSSVKMQTLLFSARFLRPRTGRAGGAFGTGGDAGESFVNGVRGNAGGHIDVPPGRELGIG